LWSFNGGNPDSINSATPIAVTTVYPNPGKYDVRLVVTNNFGCKDTALVKDYIDAIPYPEASFYPDTTILIMPDTTIQLVNTSRYYTIWHWAFGNGTTGRERNPVAIYPDSGTFKIMLLAENQLGCVDTAYVTIRVFEQETFFMPTAFTPDGDNLNEAFSPKGRGIKDYEMTIFDRWGQVLFRTKSLKYGWDGRDRLGDPVKPGIYAYKVDVEWYTGRIYSTLGSITLVK
jgi:gliding motility-associated-like protein